MKSYILKSTERGKADYGWLKANYFFSFANYHHPDYVHFGALRVLNDDSIAGGRGFDTHPHDNMEIITIVMEGALAHRDSMGHEEVIYPGEVQVMSAGTGVQHSEYNYKEKEQTSLFQIWIFPNQKNVKPRYEQKKFDAAHRINKWQKLVGSDNTDGSVMIHQNASIWMGDFDAGQKITYASPIKDHIIYTLVIDGEIESPLGNMQKRDALGWYQNELTLTSIKKSQILLLDVPLKW
ncbi:MAG: pirin family protein [Flavobacteriales bacterium]